MLNLHVKRQAVLIVYKHVNIILVLRKDKLLNPFNLVSLLAYRDLLVAEEVVSMLL